jgi:S-adenosylmethionine:tRNA ribosyltransferase-isomerase
MQVSEFDYALPPGQIAQAPPAERGASRLLVVDRAGGPLAHAAVGDLARWLRAGDLLVVNDTRVFPARLAGRRDPSGGAVACLLLGRLDADRWDALMHPGHKLPPGERVVFEGPDARLRAEVLERKYYGRRVIRLWAEGEGDVDQAIDALGHVPLPPYIKRPDTPADRDRYQTIFARARGSVAAPTAGLHFTAALVAALDAAGVERTSITLHVGYGTFKPVRVGTVEEHRVDEERYEIAPAAAGAINRARAAGRRIVAVGTTTTRALEAAASHGAGEIRPGADATDLFIHPGFEFRIVGALLTNFHLPRSSLLMLVAAFAGRERVLAAYAEAVARGYRFYSYGDAMLIV